MRPMLGRLFTDFKRGAGLASPALIPLWLAMGVGLLWLQWNLGFYGIESYSGTVKTVSSDPQYGMHVAIDSSSLDFFFDSLGNSRLPDIRAGDHVEILTDPQPEGWSIAVQSQRGTWIDSIYGSEIAPFTPQTWMLHEALRWSALALAILVGLFGLASLVRWIPSSQQRPAPSGGTSASVPSSAVDAPGAASGLDNLQASSEPGLPVVQASAQWSQPPSDRAALGVTVGSITVIGLPILELVVVIASLGSCSGYQSADLMLIALSIALVTGAISTLVLASRGTAGSPRRAIARRLGIVAVVMAVISLPINAFLVLLSGFCAVG
jgi:hypothetical protein